MPSFRYLGGERWNAVEHSVLASTNADAAYPRSNLYLGRPRLPFRFNDNTTNPVTLTVDGNRIVLVTAGVPVNAGNFTTWTSGLPQGWSQKGGGTTVTTQISPGRDGSGSNLSIHGPADAYDYFDLVVRPGEAWRFLGYLRRGTGTTTAGFRVQNLQTGNYLTSGGAWQAASVELLTNATTSWTQHAQNFTVESLVTCGYASLVTLRIFCVKTVLGAIGADQAWFDDVYVFPAIDIGSIHGHNLDAQVAAELRSSDDDSTYATEATFTKRRPSFYARLGSLTYHRYWQFRFNGAAGANASGKIYFFPVLGQQTAYSRGAPRFVDVDALFAQTRNETGARERFVHNHGGEAQRAVTIGFQHLTTAQWEELLLSLFGAQQGGAFPGVFIPIDDEPLVVHGRILPSLGADRVFRNSAATEDIRRHELTIQESAFPLVTV